MCSAYAQWREGSRFPPLPGQCRNAMANVKFPRSRNTLVNRQRGRTSPLAIVTRSPLNFLTMTPSKRSL
jgi:hypothetical protein